MKKILLLLLISASAYSQSTKISDMPSATSLTGSELVPIVQTTNKKSTITLLRGWSTLGTSGQILRVNAGESGLEFFTPTYGVTGSTGSTDNSLLRADGTGGNTLQNSPLVISDNGDIDLGQTATTSGTLRTIEAKGSNSNISVNLVPKGTGGISLSGPYTAILNLPGSSFGSEIRLFEAPINGIKRMGIKAPDDIINNVTYELPEAPSVSGQVLSSTTGGVMSWVTSSSGDVVGPSSASDNAIARYNLTTGKLIQSTPASIDDNGFLNLGDGISGGVRGINAEGSATDVSISLGSKGSGTSSLSTDACYIQVSGTSSLVTLNTSDIINPFIVSQNPVNNENGVDLIFKTGDNLENYNTGDVFLTSGITTGTGTEGNIGLNTPSVPNWQSMEKGLFIGNAVAEPTGNPSNGVFLWSYDVAASSELKVRDEAGNVTTLSPHNFSIIGEPSEPGAWSHYSEYTNENGQREAVNVDMLKLARLLEKLTGEKLVYKTKLK